MTSSCGRSGAEVRTNPHPSASPLGGMSIGVSPIEGNSPFLARVAALASLHNRLRRSIEMALSESST